MKGRRRSSVKALTTKQDKLKVGLVFFVVMSLMLACSVPGITGGLDQEGPNAETRIAQTLNAQPTETERESTDTPLPPTDTFTPDATDTPALTPTETLTPTPESAQVSVTGDTFCRTGPGSVYDQVSILNVDESTEILAKDPTGNFWFVVNPDDPSQKCWVWGKYATPDGSTNGMPVFTPPPTPTASMAFAISYDPPYEGDKETAQVFFVVENTGNMPIQSNSITVEGIQEYGVTTPMPESTTSTSNSFSSTRSGLGLKLDEILPGNTAYALSGEFSADTDLTAAVTVCSKDNLEGICLSKSLSLPDR